MIIYIVDIFVFLLMGIFYASSKYKKRARNIESFVDTIAIFLTMGLRNVSVGTDTIQYYYLFNLIGNANWKIWSIGYEKGFVLLNAIIYSLSNGNFQILILVSSFIISLSIGHFIKKESPYQCLSFLLLIFSNLLFSFSSMMRGALGLSIALWGFASLKSKKYGPFIFFVLLGSLFHLSALFLLILIPFTFNRLTKRSISNLLIIGILVIFLAKPTFSLAIKIIPKYSIYANSGLSGSNYFGSLMQFLFLLVGTFFCYSLFSKNKNRISFASKETGSLLLAKVTGNKEFTILFWSQILAIIASGCSMNVKLFSRVSEVFSLYSIVFIPLAFKYLEEKRNDKALKMYILLFLGVYLCYFVVINEYRPEWFSCINYSFFWD